MKILRVLQLSFLLTLTTFYIGTCRATYAQESATSGSVAGVVADEQGAVIGNAQIKITNISTNLVRESTSGEDGSYLIKQLPPGAYKVEVLAEGFKLYNARIDLELGTTAKINFNLALGAQSEVIEVTASSALQEGKTENSTNIDRGSIDGLPINRRNFLDFSTTTPRATADSLPSQGILPTSGLSFNGQNGRLNNITIDGVDNNDNVSGAVRTTFSQDAVQEFQVVSDDYTAEFGRALGGIINIVTRGGSNDVHGRIFFLNRNDSTSARDAFANVKPEFKQYQFGATLSGPLKKDKAFYFTSFERLSVKSSVIDTISNDTVASARRLGFTLSNGPQPFSSATTSVLARGDFQLSPNNRLGLRYNFGGQYDGAQESNGGLKSITNGGILTVSDNAGALSNTYVSTQLNLVNETRFLYSRRLASLLPVTTDTSVQISAPEGQVVFGQNPPFPQPDRLLTSLQFVDNVSITKGRNNFKFGVDFNRFTVEAPLPLFGGGFGVFVPIDFQAAFGVPGGPTLSGIQAFDPSLRTPAQRAFLTGFAAALPNIIPGFPTNVPLADLSIPITFLQSFGQTPGTPRKEVKTTLFSGFFQDDIKIKSNFLLKLGVRYDINRQDGVPNSNGNVAPRISFAYNPTQRLTLRAGYGIFFGTLNSGFAFPVNVFQDNLLTFTQTPFPFSVFPFALPGHRFPVGPTPPPGLNIIPQLGMTFEVERNFRNAYAHQSSLVFDYLVGKDTIISAGYNLVRGLKIVAPRNPNPIVRQIADPVTNAIIGRVDPTRGDIVQYESTGNSYYHALTLAVNKRFSNHFSLLAHYTFAKSIDNFIDINVAIFGANGNDPLNPGNERGLSIQDVRSRFVASGVWDLSYTDNKFLTGFQLSTIVNLSSGRPYNLIAGADLNGDGGNPPLDRPLGIGRNTGIKPGFASVDVRLQRSIKINENYKFEGFIEAFNFFNRVNINEVDGTFPPDAQGNFNLPTKDGSRFIAPPSRFRSGFAPRQLQFGVKFTF